MMKLLACICFLLGSSGFGWMKVLEYRKRHEELRYIRYVLNTMLIEMENKRGTFGETSLSISKKLRFPYSDIFAGLYHLLERERKEEPFVYWAEKIEELSQKLLLKKEETDILKGLVSCMDATTITEPLDILRQTMVEWDKVINKAEKVRSDRSRVTLVLSVSVGLVLCITIL